MQLSQYSVVDCLSLRDLAIQASIPWFDCNVAYSCGCQLLQHLCQPYRIRGNWLEVLFRLHSSPHLHGLYSLLFLPGDSRLHPRAYG